jgi:class 3 adenylate cyclase
MEYTIIGSPVKLASRLCGKAEGRVTIVSEEVYTRVRTVPGVVFGEAMQVAVKGFEKPVTCYTATPRKD